MPEYVNPDFPGDDDSSTNRNFSLDPASFQSNDQIAQSFTDQLQWDHGTWQGLQEQGFQFPDPFQSQDFSNDVQQTQPGYFQGSGLYQQPTITNELGTIHQGTENTLWPSAPAQELEQELPLQQSSSYQDFPLSEQQAPPDAQTQFSIPPPILPRPGEKPEFYDENVDQGNVCDPSSTDNFPYYDDGPGKKGEETLSQAYQRILRAQFAMGLEMRPIYPPVPNQQPGETPKQLLLRKRHRGHLQEIQERIHARKMDPSDQKNYNAAYTAEWQRQQKERRERNASRRAAVLAWRRVWDENLDPPRPRAKTPEYNDNGPEDNLYSDDFFLYDSGARRLIALEEKHRMETDNDYAQQPPPTGPRTWPLSTRCGPCVIFGYKGMSICDLTDVGDYPCSNCRRRGFYCHIDSSEETPEQRVANERQKQKRAQRVARDKQKRIENTQKRDAEREAAQEGQDGAAAATFTQLPMTRRGRDDVPLSQPGRPSAKPAPARGRSASPQRRACTQCTTMGLPRHCDGSQPCSICDELKRGELCRYEIDIENNVFGEVFSLDESEDLYSADTGRKVTPGTQGPSDLFNTSLQNAMANVAPMFGSGPSQTFGKEMNPFGALPLRQRQQPQGYFSFYPPIQLTTPQSLDLSAQTRVAASTDANHGFGGNPEYNRAEQELENASSAWNQGGEPVSYVPQFDAQDFAVSEGSRPPQQYNQEFSSSLPAQNLDFYVPPAVFPSKVTLRWDGNPSPTGPIPDGNIFPAIPRIRWYWVDEATGIPEGFQDGAAGACCEIAPYFGNTQLSGVAPGICMTKPAKACDNTDHDGAWWCTCRLCHQNQDSYVRIAQEAEIERSKARLCTSCTHKAKISATAVLGWCLCSSQLRTSWLCHNHRMAAILRLRAHLTLTKAFLVRAGQGRDNFCIGCYVNDADPQSKAWGCLACREWVIEDPTVYRAPFQSGSRNSSTFGRQNIPYYQVVKQVSR